MQRVIELLRSLSPGEELSTPALAQRLGIKVGTMSLYSGDRRVRQFKRYQGGGKTLIWSNGSMPVQKKEPKKPRRSDRQITGALDALGVKVRNKRGGFWRANADQLEWLYVDAKKAYRQMLKKAHPDKGGSREAMARVTNAWSLIHRQFLLRYPRIVKSS